MVVWVVLFFAAVMAFALSAVAGGGAGLVLMPILGVILAPESVPAALSIGTAVSSVSRIAFFFQNIRWAIVVRFVPLALPAAWGGVLLLRQMQPAYLSLLLGLFLLGNLPFMLRGRRGVNNSQITGPQSMVWLPVIGVLAGFISGFTGAVGLLFNQFYHKLGLEKSEIVATRAANDVLLHFVKVILYVNYGMVSQATLLAGGLVAVAALAASFGMKLFLHHIPDHLFKQVGHGAAVLAGVAMMVMAGQHVVAQDQVVLQYTRQSHAVGMAVDWRQHRLSVEMEAPIELEVRHSLIAQEMQPSSNAPLQNATLSILHISPWQGVYVTRLE
ncbi:sulfite exporter TauE/SafE family protein [Acetobacter okinawensis]|uniref:sulfite exporter TauE/SafE family protein n=1 Tax=Acetobacter okinawensis TaxID=1076594 RepID=UPI000A3D13EF|nr:sulfite exporter TauE/SafE family protein [Acetobacter okinawensis]